MFIPFHSITVTGMKDTFLFTSVLYNPLTLFHFNLNDVHDNTKQIQHFDWQSSITGIIDVDEWMDRWMYGQVLLGNLALTERKTKTGKWNTEFIQLLS